jgi:hypothetical protein
MIGMRRFAWIAPLLTLGLAGCGSMTDAERFELTTPGTDDMVVREVGGGDEEKQASKKPTRGEVRVIRGWADALREGRVNEAAGFFAVPTIVVDGTNPRRSLPDKAAVLDFNRGLPCGARLVDAVRGRGKFVIATFRLTERSGPGAQSGCSVGALAATAILVEDKHIVQWLREPDPVQPPDTDTS